MCIRIGKTAKLKIPTTHTVKLTRSHAYPGAQALDGLELMCMDEGGLDAFLAGGSTDEERGAVCTAPAVAPRC